MLRSRLAVTLMMLLLLGSNVNAANPDSDFSKRVQQLLELLPQHGSPLQEEAAQLKRLAQQPPAAAVSQSLQEILDKHVLVEVQVNPESRVKAQRGPAAATLRAGENALILVKIKNEAGVTQELELTSPNFVVAGREAKGQWLRKKPLPGGVGKLNGHLVEYVPFVLEARQDGKREALLTFDVGQGTQDLGFRAEVPILFSIAPAKGR